MPKKWKREDITPEVLRQLLYLDEDTGKLYWKERGPEWFKNDGRQGAMTASKKWNTRYAGKGAFTALWGSEYKEYRGSVLKFEMCKIPVVFKIFYNKEPLGVVSTIDGNRLNTKPSNLIDSTRTVSSARFCNLWQESETGYKGVSVSMSLYERGDAKYWQSQCAGPIGIFPTPIEAARAYDKAAFEKWGEHARLNFPEEYGLTRDDDDMPEGYYAATT